MDLQRLRSLGAFDRALVCVAVLLDGRDATTYVENDATRGTALKRAAEDLASIEMDLRMSYAASVLRKSLEELQG